MRKDAGSAHNPQQSQYLNDTECQVVGFRKNGTQKNLLTTSTATAGVATAGFVQHQNVLRYSKKSTKCTPKPER